MPATNRLREPLFILLIPLSLLLILSLSDSSMEIWNHQFKRVDLLSDIKARGIFMHAPVSSRLLSDSVIRHYESECAKIKTDPALAAFFESLLQTQQKKKKTRIAYFGDSMIEGDLVTQDLRTTFQDTFGGVGVGFMPITSIVAGFRQTIFHTFSGNWQTYSLLDHSGGNFTLGITGFDFVPAVTSATDTAPGKSGSWVKYSSVGRKGLDKFYNVNLYYGKSEGENNYLTIAGHAFRLKGSLPVNELQLVRSKPIQSIQAFFSCQDAMNLFGFSMEGDSGIYVDNFSFRGNSGMPLSKIPGAVLTGLNNHLNYDLIILHYGVNVVNNKVTDFSWYERGMTDVVNHIRSAIPNASILIISTSDKSFYTNGAYVTDPSVPLVIDVQKRVAEKTGVAFWNLYEAMGGYNSMVKWVQGDTVLANKDYTHPNFRGAKKIAGMLYQYLITDYKGYVKKQKV